MQELLSSVLLITQMFIFYSVMQRGRFGFLGVLGVILLAVLTLSHYRGEPFQMFELCLMGVGGVLIMWEAFTVAGLGIYAALGIPLLLSGLMLLLAPNVERLLWLVATLIIGLLLLKSNPFHSES